MIYRTLGPVNCESFDTPFFIKGYFVHAPTVLILLNRSSLRLLPKQLSTSAMGVMGWLVSAFTNADAFGYCLGLKTQPKGVRSLRVQASRRLNMLNMNMEQITMIAPTVLLVSQGRMTPSIVRYEDGFKFTAMLLRREALVMI